MRRGKRVLEKDNLFIYLGTVIFFLLAIALGIIIYMTNKTTDKLKNEQLIEQSEISQTGEDIEEASTEIGKTVDEQEKKEEDYEVKTIDKEELNSVVTNNTSLTENKNTSKKDNNIKEENNPVDEPDTVTQIESEPKEIKKEISFIKPTEGEVICEFAKDNLIYSETLKEWITHTGIDIKADKTSVIKAATDGIIKTIVNDPRYGLTITIEHDEGYETVYSNLLTAEFVVEGEEVTQGQTIGTAGNTASFESSMESHLHFELLKDGEYVDPTIYLK